MDLKLSKNVVKGVCQVSGPQVSFVLGDTGQANVLINVVLSNGKTFHFPDGPGTQVSLSATLPPADYDCAIMVAAFSHGAFGTSFNASVSIGGKKVASAVGELAAGAASEDDMQSFVLRVS